ncbi:MAG: hypothetical protein DHS20C16_21560 [Phycisphaerae bacterium]|nr:MAG: hypothetical protein DHS20C16_21560 [Phycisphaerae bacterium]
MTSTKQIIALGLMLQATVSAQPREVSPSPENDSIKGQTVPRANRAVGFLEGLDAVVARDAIKRSEKEEPILVRGEWVIPTRRSTYYPHSGAHNLVNKHGDIEMGIGFNRLVDFIGFYVAGQSTEAVWAEAIRVSGFRDNELVGQTKWFDEIDENPKWMTVNLRGVDRIVVEALPSSLGVGFYGLDDLAFAALDDNGQPSEPILIDFEDGRFHQKLSASRYAGLNWEFGSSETSPAWIIPPPAEPPEADSDRIDADDVVGRGIDPQIPPPGLLLNFEGILRGDAGSFSAPPDTHGAMGPNHFVEVVNRNFAIYSRDTGAEMTNVNLSSFLPGSSGDPRVLFDYHSGRWIVIVSDFNTKVFIAVSSSDDPTGTWFKTDVTVSTGADAGCFPDYPTLGVDDDGIYVTSYMVGCGMSIFAFDKAPLLSNPQNLGTVTAFRGLPFEGAIQPAMTYGDSGGELFVSRISTSQLQLRQLSGSLTSPSLVDLGTVSVTPQNAPPDAEALGSVVPLDTVGDRVMNSVYRNGSLWLCYTVGVDGRAACQWYEIDMASQTVAQQGLIDSPTRHYFFPSLAVNAVDQIVMGFSGSSPTEYASTYYTGRRSSDPLGMMAPPTLYREGLAEQNIIDSFGRNRFGDYSYTSVDPEDDLTFWTVQEFVHSVDIWGTQVASLRVGDCNGNGLDDLDDIAAGTSADCNANTVPDECESRADCQSNGIQDFCDIALGSSADCTGNKIPDECEPDCNNNGTADSCDIADQTSQDCTGNSVPDECEPDCNTNGTADSCDIAIGVSDDCNANGRPDACEIAEIHDCCEMHDDPGCSNDDIASCVCARDPFCCTTEWDRLCSIEVLEFDCGSCEFADDCNISGIPDECELEGPGFSHNCCETGHGAGCSDPTISACVCAFDSFCCNVEWDSFCVDQVEGFGCGDCSAGANNDCNENGVPDECDLAGGTSSDCDLSGLPDECEGGCNNNGVPDICDVAAGTSNDCNSNGVPDECEGGCNNNGAPDICDIMVGTSNDCDNNSIPDECEGGCNFNGVPDICEIEAIHNCCETQHGTGCSDVDIESCVCVVDPYCCDVDWDRPCADQVELLGCGTCDIVSDCNENLIPDECEVDGAGSGNCCTTGHGAGCEDPVVEACVCDIFPFCCSDDWDSLCVFIVELFECGQCNGVERIDCNTNGIPDDCEDFDDCDLNGLPDECDPDCNQNGIPDTCDLASGTSEDCNDNNQPDECEILPNFEEIPELASFVHGDVDDCDDARLACPGRTYTGSTVGATSEGDSGCTDSTDVWYQYVPAFDGLATFSLCGSPLDTVMSVHSDCPGSADNLLACNDDSCDLGSQVSVNVESGVGYWIRITGFFGFTGSFVLNIDGPPCVTEDCDNNGVPDSCDEADLIVDQPDYIQGCPGDTVEVTIDAPTADGFQWYRGSTPLTDDGRIEGATTKTLRINEFMLADAGLYTCIASRACIETLSGPIELEVFENGTIQSQPPALVSACAGEVEIIAVVTDGDIASYAWQKNGVPLTNEGNISGTDSPHLRIADVTFADEADSPGYQCYIVDACSNAILSSPSVLDVVGPDFTIQPVDTCVESGETAMFTAAVSSPGGFSTFTQWHRDGMPLVDGGGISGVFGSTLTIENATQTNAGVYSLRALSIGPNCVLFSDPAELTVGNCPACAMPGDSDADGDIDLHDMRFFLECFGEDSSIDPTCACANTDTASPMIDLADWHAMASVISGPYD